MIEFRAIEFYKIHKLLLVWFACIESEKPWFGCYEATFLDFSREYPIINASYSAGLTRFISDDQNVKVDYIFFVDLSEWPVECVAVFYCLLRKNLINSRSAYPKSSLFPTIGIYWDML